MKPASYSIGCLASSARGRIAQLDIHVVPYVGDRRAAVDVLDLADEIDQSVLRAAALGESKFPSRNLHHDRDEVLCPVQLEIIDLDRDGQVGDRVAQHQGIFELPLFVDRSKFAELFAGVSSPAGNPASQRARGSPRS